MTVPAGEESTDARRRILVRASVAFGILALAFIAVVITLNVTIFSASGFVSSYLSAVARHDLQAALAMPGVAAHGTSDDAAPATASELTTPSDALLLRDTLSSLDTIELIGDEDLYDGTHALTYSYELDGSSQKSTFVVERRGIHLGFFTAWSFAQSPLATLEVTPLNTIEFEANGVSTVAVNGAGQPTPFTVLVPSAFSISHKSTYLVAEPTTTLITQPATSKKFTLEVQASDEFVDAVQQELQTQLDGCATQQVLQPTGCPFGKSISDRIDSLPQWSIVDYPLVTIVPGEQLGTWLIEPAQGAARLSVDVKSLFDGSVTRLEEDVDFSISYLATFTGDGGLTLTPLHQPG